MKASELREKTVDDLRKELDSLCSLILSLRIKKGVGSASSSSLDVLTVRRDIARVKLVLSEKGVFV
ncbi:MULTISPECIES: 50S ribosomal protein L29 [Candidatus Ichthyocystis]|uniref:50S ribosomal protein L29 n=1 Tax=Candidatus Ichthyocystis TaxID=2929841 RepID=UPI000A472A2F|nr:MULTISPECIES: 50S ribosomal protein L29 [Ichthyocystis]